jgi:GxxExxY protein
MVFIQTLTRGLADEGALASNDATCLCLRVLCASVFSVSNATCQLRVHAMHARTRGVCVSTENTETQRARRNSLVNSEDNDLLTQRIIGCAIEVHRTLGPGLLESAYEQCMAHEMTLQEVAFRLQVPTPVQYKGLGLDCAYRADIVVHERVIVELESVDTLTALHHAQLLTYMKVSGMQIGLLINFNVPRLVDGIKRFRL